MATVSYYLASKKKDKKGRAQIMLQCVHNRQRFRYYTGEKIDPIFWSKSKKNPIKPSYGEVVKLGNYLKSLEDKVTGIALDYKTTHRNLSIEMLKTKFLEESDNEMGKSFLELFDLYINSSAINRAPGTIKNYKNSLHYLKEFQKDKNFDFQFDAINMAFYDRFVEYMVDKKKLSNNTVGRNIKVLKSFLNWAIENKYNKNLEYKKFKVATEQIEIIYLTDRELNNLFHLKITDKVLEKAKEEYDILFSKESLERARDLFCFGCYTGLRFSDIASLESNNIKEDEIQVRTQKTKDMLSIPLIPQAASILKKYENSLPVISNQKLNLALKNLGKVAKIKEDVAIQRYRGAKRVDTKTPKYKLITTHTARRTFITLSLEKGIRPEVVMSITGHKDYKTFKAYIKITDSVKKEELLNAWK